MVQPLPGEQTSFPCSSYCDNRHGCLPGRLGSSLGPAPDFRPLGSCSIRSYQCARASSSPQRKLSLGSTPRPGRFNPIRQQVSSRVYSAGGRHALPPSHDHQPRPSLPSGPLGNQAKALLSSRNSQYRGGCPLSVEVGRRMVPPPRYHPRPVLMDGSPIPRPIRGAHGQCAPPVLFDYLRRPKGISI